MLLDEGGEEFFIGLLFYHLKRRCYVVIELNAGKFRPEHLGQLGFYLTAVDRQVKRAQANPSIGLLPGGSSGRPHSGNAGTGT